MPINPITREEFPELVSFLDGDSNDPRTALLEVYDDVFMQGLEAAAKLIEDGYDKESAVPFRKDGQWSKHDKCPHDRYQYEDCEQCAVLAIRALASKPQEV